MSDTPTRLAVPGKKAVAARREDAVKALKASENSRES
jgi:hypothetical protein